MNAKALHLVLVGVLSPSLVLAAPAIAAASDAATSPAAKEERAASPNLLQFTSGGHALGFTSGGVYAATGTHALRVDFVDANPVTPQADSSASPTGKAAPLGRVAYSDLWDGIGLTFTAGAGSIYTTTYTLSPGADAGDIRLRYNAPLTLNNNGTLTIAFDTGAMIESAPIAWQDIQGRRVPVDVSFCPHERELTFALGQYDPRYVLTIDPTLVWNAFLGGTGYDEGWSIAVDGSGNVYVTGDSNVSWGSPVRAYDSDIDSFAAKLDSAGALTWNTFLGGTGTDIGHAIAVDGNGDIYVAGSSNATWGSPETAYDSFYDGFAAKLDSSGALTWNTFLGGAGIDYGAGLAVDVGGNVYVAGYSNVTWGTPVQAHSTGQDAFAAELDPSGALTWSTFLGGSSDDFGYGIGVDSSGNVYVAGYSYATWGSPVRAYTAGSDAFAAKLDGDGALTWNTFLGGAGLEYGYGIAVDGSGNVYAEGNSDATWGSPVRAYTSVSDAFAAKLDSSGNLAWNTFLGGSGADAGAGGIAVDAGGNVYLAGHSQATWGTPVRPYTDYADAFAANLNSSGALAWNTFLGSSFGYDYCWGLAVDGNGSVYVTGSSPATWGTPVRAYNSGGDAFVAKLGVMLTFKSQGANDGWVLESTETSGVGGSNDSIATTLRVGDDAADKQYRGILSFNTASLPDNAVITKVTLKVKKQGLTGTDPFTTHGTLMAAIRKPYFGSAVTLANSDFQAALSKQVGFSGVPVSNWYSTNNNPVIWPYINLTGTTQFRLRLTLDDNDDMGADYVRFYSGNAGASVRPQLIIEYYVP